MDVRKFYMYFECPKCGSWGGVLNNKDRSLIGMCTICSTGVSCYICNWTGGIGDALVSKFPRPLKE